MNNFSFKKLKTNALFIQKHFAYKSNTDLK